MISIIKFSADQRFISLFLLIILTLVLLSTSVIYAQNDEPKIAFVLDVSGSMGDEINGQEKLEIARQTIFAFLPSLQQKGINLGLLDFAGCGNVQFPIPVGSNTYSKIASRVSGLSASGGTPLADALEKAANNLRSQSGERRIFLLSDGKETCGGSPVEVARQIAGDGIKIYVVGFDVDSSANNQLQQIASAGGGSYSRANNAQQLQISFDKLTEEIKSDVLEEMRSCVELGGGEAKKEDQEENNTNSQKIQDSTGTSPASQNSSAKQDSSNQDQTKTEKIDGFEELSWGSSTSTCQNKFGKPHSKNARDLAGQLEVDLPSAGETVWLYKDKKFGASSSLWFGFDGGQDGPDGLLWAKRRWGSPAADDINNISRRAKEEINNLYGSPLENNTWIDDRGKIIFTKNSDMAEVKYFSGSLP
ncbi:MAG: vWA domain-containing protein [bacterium]